MTASSAVLCVAVIETRSREQMYQIRAESVLWKLGCS